MTPAEKKEFEELKPLWDAKKLSKGKMLRYVALAKFKAQDEFNEALAKRVKEGKNV